jgi:hypothetical protein
MKRLIIDIEDMHLANDVALLAFHKGLSIENYVIWLLKDDVHEAARSDAEFRRAEDNYYEGDK